MTTVFMFPSQSSLYAGMIQKIVRHRPWVRYVLEEASDTLRQDLTTRYLNDSPEVFHEKADQRLGMFLVNYMYQMVLEEAGVNGDYSLGFSLGEYNHLVHIGALSFTDALHLLVRQAPPDKPDPTGERAIVYRIRLHHLREFVERGQEHGVVEIGGMLSPHIHLLVGEPPGVDWVMERLKAEAPKSRAMKFPVKLPLHSSLLKEVGERFRVHLDEVPFQVPKKPYLPNVLGRILRRPSPKRIADLTAEHLYKPVRWRHSIDALLSRHPDAALVEVGPRRVLCGFLYLEREWWNPGTKMYITDAMDEDSDKYLLKVVDELGGKLPARFARRAF